MNNTQKLVSVIGLDDDCVNLACLLKKMGYQVTVFDPTRSNIAQPCMRSARDLEHAIESSSTIITCFHDCALMDAKLSSPETTYSLYDKGLLNLILSDARISSASRTMAAWAQREGVHYVEARLEMKDQDNMGEYEMISSVKTETGRCLVTLLEQIGKKMMTPTS